MSDKLYTQQDILNLVNQYNTKDKNVRKIIKHNYIRILNQYNIEPKEIMELGFNKNNTYTWSTKCQPNVPMLNQALTIACAFNFDIYEFLKEI
jgi:hypothetical protein